MKTVDLMIVGAGPVGLMCAYLAQLCGLTTFIVDKSKNPLEVGRADALNARTLQLLEIIDLFKDLYPKGKPCNTSSIWKSGQFTSRQFHWWENIEGCFHKHFLMLGQSFVEQLLDKKLNDLNASVLRETLVQGIDFKNDECETLLSNGEMVKSKFIIGSDGSQSFVRKFLNIPFEIIKPQINWLVLDAEFKTDFKKVPEIIVFQNETSDVAWIPREGEIDRFYVRADNNETTVDEALLKINKAISPHKIEIKKLVWFSKFSVKESVAEKFSYSNKVFLVGDSCHIHSVNGGQGLNTGLADAFNLIWKLNLVIHNKKPTSFLDTYESERKPVALSVVETSGELVRSTKYSKFGTHANDYIDIVERRAGNITGMGICYGNHELIGKRLHDFEIFHNQRKTRIYSLLDYTKFTLIVNGKTSHKIKLPDHIQLIEVEEFEAIKIYLNLAIFVRPDGYISDFCEINNLESMVNSNEL